MIHAAAPAVHVKKRTRLCDVEHVIHEAAYASTGTPLLTPVYAPGLGRVAYVRGRRGSPSVDVWRLPEKMWAGFSSYDDLISEMTAGKKFSIIYSKAHTANPSANAWHDLWPVTGQPGAGAYGGTARTAKQFDDTTTGAMLSGGNVTPDTKHIISSGIVSSAGTPTLWLADRVLTYESCGFTAATNQVMTNTLTAQRYNGAGLPGLMCMVVADTATGATAANMTRIEYTDQAGTTGQLMPTAVAKAIGVSIGAPLTSLGARCALPLGVSPWVEMATGDTGMRSIENYTTSAANTGTLAFLLVRPLVLIPTYAAGVGSIMDTVAQVAGLERVYDGACLQFLAFFPTATATTLTGRIDVAWG